MDSSAAAVKRSRGVTFFGWLFIIGGTFSFINCLFPRSYFLIIRSGPAVYILYLFSLTMAIVAIFCGINLLKLRIWARYLVIALCLVNILYSPLAYRMTLNSVSHARTQDAFNTYRDRLFTGRPSRNTSSRLLPG